MKQIILFSLLTLISVVAVAQNYSITDRYERYHYTKWYDECPQFYDSCTRFRITSMGDVTCVQVKEEFTPVPMKVKGLVAFVDKTPAWENSVYNYRLPEYLYLYQKINDTLHLIDSLRWDTAAPRQVYWTKNPYTQEKDQCLAYEAYFSKPYTVDSVFAIGGSAYSNANYWWEEMGDYWDLIYKHTRYVGMQEDTCWASFTFNCKPYGTMRYYEQGQWYVWRPRNHFQYGLYMAITDFYNLEVGSCDTTMGHVEGSGRFPEEAPVRIEGVADSGYHFTQWNDGNTENPRIVTIIQDTSFEACFAIGVPSFDVDVRTENSLKGTVSGSGIYDSNEVATISAMANNHYRFDHWNDGDTLNPRSIVVVSDTVFKAYFVGEGQEGINGAETSYIDLSPNPTTGKVKISSNEGIKAVKVFDMAGKEVVGSTVNGQQSAEMDLSGLLDGTYLVKIETERGTVTRKLVKK